MRKHDDETTDLNLRRLEDLKDFQVAEGDPDIRGWDVRTPDGKKIGKVEELIVDPAERRARYMELKVDREALGIDDDRHILVPVGAARVREDGHDVLIERLPARGLADAPAYKRGPITRDYETSLRNYYGATVAPSAEDYYRDDLYDEDRFRNRDAARGAAAEVNTPRIGDNEVTLPLVDDQEIVLRRPDSNDEIVISRKKTGESETRDS
jgi:photosynthetic reaction center H subunit